LVNNAGFGLFGTMEELSKSEIRALYEVNVLGVIHATKAFLPHFRMNRHGTILNIASVTEVSPLLPWVFTAQPKPPSFSSQKLKK
jgi:short-subunit dehydrogenase